MSIRINEIKHRERREALRLASEKEQYLDAMFEAKAMRSWISDSILGILTNDYWLSELRGATDEQLVERVRDAITQTEDYLWDKKNGVI